MNKVEQLKLKYGQDHPLLSKITEDSLRRDPNLRIVVYEYSELLYFLKNEPGEKEKVYTSKE